MPVTIKDISKHLGLSVSTVSKALNGYPDVAAKTRSAVLAATEQLGYQPSATARNLRRQRTDKIGVVHPVKSFESETFVGFFRGLVYAAQDFGYNLNLYTAPESDSAALQRICRGREVDGMILIGTGIAGVQEASMALLEREGIPFVVLGNPVEDSNVSFVAPDNRGGALAVMQHLIELGHQRIGYIARPDDPENNAQRFEGYRQALAEAGIDFDDTLITEAPYTPYSGMGAMRVLLELPKPPSAIFAFNDHVAIDASRTVLQRDLQIPEDLAVAGFDNIPSSLVASPALTTVHQPQIEMGKQALEVLLALIGGRDDVQRLTYQTELIVRASTVTKIL
ncbi:MAG: LacI family DNA-binding transcriptional regulator [Trueperaceae bacterium]|nr:MAG: LacI family DNA-binding transcriptional regulator [Trueperaceae bacterium]